MTYTQRKHKILIVTQEAPENTPLTRELLVLLEQLDKRLFEIYVTVHQEGPFMARLQATGVQVIQLKGLPLPEVTPQKVQRLNERMSQWLWKRTRGEKIIRLILEHEIDLVYTHSLSAFEGAYAAHKTGRPHIWRIQKILPGNRKLFGVFNTIKTLKMIAQYSDQVVCSSDAVKRQFPGWQRQPEIYKTIYTGVNPLMFSPDSPSLSEKAKGFRARHCILDNRILLLAFLLNEPDKGLADLKEACYRLEAQGLDFHIVMIGDLKASVVYEDFQGLAAVEEKRVSFLGMLPYEDWPEAVAASDIVISASYHPPTGNGMIEAMMMALPVVALNSGAAPEFVLPYQTGILCRVGHPVGLTEAISQLISDPDLRKTMGLAGQQKALEHFVMERYVQEIQAVFQKLIETFLQRYA